ncbi:MAG: hypothetical protein DRP94_03085 [Candidatus Latescibacterota bacterium]|nr:MAG: hypothetical protein DRP94_03085 [Candidatus Latescibacterota bacterium]RKY73337.1 MAG: hypothetical protein DRQ14_04500 [Candidatus Latescibacterota bacterium]
MESFEVIVQSSARRELRRLPPDIQKRIFRALEGLERCPVPRRAVKIIGAEHAYRLRVGAYRVIYKDKMKGVERPIIDFAYEGVKFERAYISPTGLGMSRCRLRDGVLRQVAPAEGSVPGGTRR